uniref:Uncharacterized protein n=2 Tax=Salix viminalis TaxID=40686 RepID=A0A6N2KYX2_SALVM
MIPGILCFLLRLISDPGFLSRHSLVPQQSCHSCVYMDKGCKHGVLLLLMVVRATANLAGANMVVRLGGQLLFWNLATLNLQCTPGFDIFLLLFIAGCR